MKKTLYFYLNLQVGTYNYNLYLRKITLLFLDILDSNVFIFTSKNVCKYLLWLFDENTIYNY